MALIIAANEVRFVVGTLTAFPRVDPELRLHPLRHGALMTYGA